MSKPFDPVQVKRNQMRKFRWLELVAQHPGFRRKPIMYRLAIYVSKCFHTGLGYIEFSIDGAAAWLDVDPSQIVRARNELVKLGWLLMIKAATPSRKYYSANRYDLAGGPEDYLLDDDSPALEP